MGVPSGWQVYCCIFHSSTILVCKLQGIHRCPTQWLNLTYYHPLQGLFYFLLLLCTIDLKISITCCRCLKSLRGHGAKWGSLLHLGKKLYVIMTRRFQAPTLDCSPSLLGSIYKMLPPVIGGLVFSRVKFMLNFTNTPTPNCSTFPADAYLMYRLQAYSAHTSPFTPN